MTSIGRYTLIIEDENNRRLVPFSTSNDNKTLKNVKVDLATIDRYTTRFHTPKKILEDLESRQIKVTGYRKMYISYHSEKEERRLEVAFSDQEQLSVIAQKSNSKVNINSNEFNKFLNNFLRLLENNSFYAYLKEVKTNDMYIINDKSRLIDYLDDCLAERLNHGKYDHYVIKKIKEHMGSYKKFRDIYFAMQDYYKMFDDIFYFLDRTDFYTEVIESQYIRPETKVLITDHVTKPTQYTEHRIREEIFYAELLSLSNLTEIYYNREREEDEAMRKENNKAYRELKKEEKHCNQYPEAFVEHRYNPYSSYQEEREFDEYLKQLGDEELARQAEPIPKAKIKLLRKKVDSNQISIFDKTKE